MNTRLWKLGSRSLVLLGASAAVIGSSTNTSVGQGCVLAPPGLIAWYRAEGNAADSADANTGILVNGAGFGPGKVGLGFDLNGGNEYVALPPNLFPYPTSGTGNAPFSFEVWFSTLTGGVILGQQNAAPFTAPSAYVPAVYVGTDGRLYVAMFWNAFARIISPRTVNDGAFHHVAVTFNGTTEIVYLDGVVIGSGPWTQLAYAPNYQYQLGTGFTAGNWPAANGSWFSFNGIIDEASVYNRALAASEVSAIFGAGSNGKCPLVPGLPPQITTQPTNQTVAPGGNATFRVTATGTAPLTFQWQLNGQNLANSTHYVGATSNVLTIVNVGPSDIGSYRVVVSNPFGTTNSAVATLGLSQGCVLAPPGLIAWYRAEGNAADSAGANTGILVNGAGFGPGKVGLGFDLNGGNDYVALPPNLFPYPTSGTGNAPFSFEVWFSTLTGGVILGQQNAAPFAAPSAYVPAVYVGTDGRLYVAMFWNAFARIISPGTVNDGAFHHVAVTFNGTTEIVYLDGAVIGSGPWTQLAYAPNYQYQLGTGYTAGNWPAANGNWFNFNGIIDEASVYNRALSAAEVAGIFGAGSSGKCPLFPGLPPQITSQPTNQTVAVGGNASFSVTAVNGPLTFQWQLNGQNLANSTHYVGATSNVLTIVNVGPSDIGSYRVVVSNAFGSVTSAVATLTLLQACSPAPPGLIAWYKAEGNAQDSADARHGTLVNGAGFGPGKVGLGFDLSGGNDFVALPANLFPYPASGNAPFSFEVWFSTLTGGVILGQQNTAPFTTPSGYVPAVYVGTDGRLYVSMFWNAFARIISPGTVNDGAFHHVAVTFNGTTETVYLDGTVMGSRPWTQIGYAPDYQYQLGTGYTAGNWPAANGGWFNFNGIIDEASVYNRALSASEVAGIFGAGSSGKCPLPASPPVILSQPSDQTVHLGANATFIVTAAGTAPLNYQWQFNGQNLANSTHYVGATSNVLTIVNVGFADAGSYRVVISNAAGSISSFPVTLSLFESCAPVPPGLVAWYKAEGNAQDSADAHHGTLVNSVAFGAGKVGLGFYLFGGNDYVALPPNLFPYPTSGTGNAPFSFELWFVTATGGVILGQQNTIPFTAPSAYVPAVYVGTDGRLYVAMFWSGFARIISPGRVNDGVFHHVAVTYDGTTEVVYLDGMVIGSRPFTQLAYATNYQYQLGTGYTAGLWPAANGGWFSFTGVIDEASIYNRALSASEVSAIFVAGSIGKCPLTGSLAQQIMDEAADQLISPELAIESDGMNMVISWPANFTGYQVYWAPTATDRNWEIVTNAVVVANGLNQIVVPASGSGRFFRLQK